MCKSVLCAQVCNFVRARDGANATVVVFAVEVLMGHMEYGEARISLRTWSANSPFTLDSRVCA